MKKFIFPLLLIFLITACDDECHETQNCVADVLKERNMVPYTGQELACHFYLTLYEFRGEQYFLLNNHCADMVVNPFNCAGETLCDRNEAAACQAFDEEAEYIGIVGIAEP